MIRIAVCAYKCLSTTVAMFTNPEDWAIPFNKGTPLPMTELFAYPGTKILP